MSKSWMFSSVFLVTYLSYASSLKRETFIFGGANINIKSASYYVQLSFYGRPRCGGAIISKDWIITAAHCLVDQNKNLYTVLTGSDQRGLGESHEVTGFILHENFDPDTLSNDIGLIKLQKPLKFSDKQNFIGIRTKPLADGELLETVGLGKVTLDGEYPKVLQLIMQPVIDRKSCQENYINRRVTKKMFCLGWVDETQTWEGDSGGPVSDLRGRLVGLVSWGSYQRPDVNTNVINYRDWIKKKTHSNDI